jgi:hypothetical protein
MTAILCVDPSDVHNRLAELGLEEEPLRDVVRRGYLAFITCTANHPRLIPGIWAWGETVRALREYTLPIGWSRSDDNNYSVVIDPGRRVAVAVATGDEGTGRIDATPSTKAPKGPSTNNAIIINKLQLSLFAEAEPEPPPATADDSADERVTWILLIRRTAGEVRCELSLPYSMGIDGHIDDWRERILLGSVQLDGDLIEIAPPPTQPDITIDVKRRA